MWFTVVLVRPSVIYVINVVFEYLQSVPGNSGRPEEPRRHKGTGEHVERRTLHHGQVRLIVLKSYITKRFKSCVATLRE